MSERSAIEIARQVSAHMVGWHAVEVTYDGAVQIMVARITRESDGATIELDYPMDGRGRVNITPGPWPRYADGSWYRPGEHLTISVGANRSGEAIASEIERRMLPKYLPMYAKALDEVRDGNARADAADACRDRIAKVGGGEVRTIHGQTHIYCPIEAVRSISVVASSPPKVRLELFSIDEVTAARILTLLRQREEAASAELSDESVKSIVTDITGTERTTGDETAEDAPAGAASATVGSGEEVVR